MVFEVLRAFSRTSPSPLQLGNHRGKGNPAPVQRKPASHLALPIIAAHHPDPSAAPAHVGHGGSKMAAPRVASALGSAFPNAVTPTQPRLGQFIPTPLHPTQLG